MKYLSGTINSTKVGTIIQLSTCFGVSCVRFSFFVGYQQTEGSKTINISGIEMSVTVATEALCGVPLG